MLQEVTTENIGGVGYLPDFGHSPVDLPIGLIDGRTYKSIPKCLFETFIISADIDLQPPCSANVTVTTERSPRIITPIQAYELALNALRTHEDKWNAYVKEEASVTSVM